MNLTESHIFLRIWYATELLLIKKNIISIGIVENRVPVWKKKLVILCASGMQIKST